MGDWGRIAELRLRQGKTESAWDAVNEA